MNNKCIFLLIFSCGLSVNASCESTSIYKYIYYRHCWHRPFGYCDHDQLVSDPYNSLQYDGIFVNRPYGSRMGYNPRLRNRENQIITCSNASLNTSLNFTYEKSSNHHLKIVNSKIPIITTNSSLFRLHGFDKLTLKHLGIEQIEIGAFQNLLELNELDLSYNKLVTIPEEINTLTNLKKLDVASNNISDMNNNNFSKLAHLTDLTLTGNNLKELHGNVFEDLVSLENIDISNNPLTKFEEVRFKSLVSLVVRNTSLKTFDVNLSKFNLSSLDISNGNLELINFDNFPNVRLLNLNNNNLTQIQNLNTLHSLKAELGHNFISKLDEIPANIDQLHLRYNKITKVKYSKRINQQSIIASIVNLEFNEIFEIDPYVFSNMKLLESIKFNNNNLEIVHENTIVDCPALKYVDISFNKITHIKSNALRGVPALITLNLSHNKLKILNFEMLPRENGVINLYVNHNELNGLDDEMFQDVFAHVKWITVNHNAWLCEDLEHILGRFQTRNINIQDPVKSGNVYSIEGFSCIDNVGI